MKMRYLAAIFCLTTFELAVGLSARPASADKTPKQIAQESSAGKTKQAPAAVAPAGPEDLKTLLAQMNVAAKTFKTAQAGFEWDQYQLVVNETDVQKGQMYLRRTAKGMDAALHITSPDPKQVLFKDGKLSFYQPRIDQVTEHKAGGNRGEAEAFMSLGFGASGDDLEKSYELKMEGWETVAGVKTAKLDLTPKDPKLKTSLSKIVLWIDPVRSLAVQQKFLEPSGDYRLARYSNIRINEKSPEDAFKLKTTPHTKVVPAQ